MGQNISLYIPKLINKQVYAVENVMDVEYLRSLKKVRDGGIGKILNLFEYVAVSGVKDKEKSVRPRISDIFL
jgi:hypothetical protein